ncbi:YbeD family protein [Kushneria phosphatilytica]|uniref:UPF0250 protein FY550_07125 n=1 Tax=Kushneria phosphatilytica TaxID=657387 RepID=A0A1S1P0U5_9GAMM|nr:DUF493 domain-containing protein [Kushneria phosphatilytica]OHV13048.1 hypothetical protein BH688_03365 [Kushneria phosphatilytica]QEL10921.1 DUF493 domain-containing protein [Kushneria phosphatilytica]
MTSSPSEGAAVDEQAPKIEFPCHYTIRIVGNNAVDFDTTMLDVVERFDPQLDRDTVKHHDSRNGKYRSLHVTLYTTGEEQLKALFNELKATGMVQMVL